MKYIQHLSYKDSHLISSAVDEAYVVWIAASRKFVLLEEPAWFVISSFEANNDIDSLAELVSARYGLEKTDCKAFVLEIMTLFNNWQTANAPQPSILNEFEKELIHFEAKDSYQFGDKTIAIHYQTNTIRHYFHPLFAHKVVANPSPIQLNIQLYESNHQLVMDSDAFESKCWQTDDVPHFKGAVLGEMLNFIYQKSDKDWMMTLHASGVSNGKEAILFSAAAGSGKSTLAALLQSQGFDLLSDDFIAVDLTGDAYRFDMALSVKEGALHYLSEHYPELENSSATLAANGKSVRYLAPKDLHTSHSHAPANTLIFVQYTQEVDFELSELTTKEAYQLLLPEVFVTPTERTVEAFMEWMRRLRFFSLRYSNSDLAMQSIKELFDHDK